MFTLTPHRPMIAATFRDGAMSCMLGGNDAHLVPLSHRTSSGADFPSGASELAKKLPSGSWNSACGVSRSLLADINLLLFSEK